MAIAGVPLFSGVLNLTYNCHYFDAVPGKINAKMNLFMKCLLFVNLMSVCLAAPTDEKEKVSYDDNIMLHKKVKSDRVCKIVNLSMF